MRKNYQYLAVILFTVTLISCNEDVETPAIQFDQKVVASATSATIVFDGQDDLSQFDEVGYLLGRNKELTVEESQKLIFDSRLGSSQRVIAEGLLPEQNYFFSFYTVVGESVRVYESSSFTTYKRDTWVKRAVHPLQEAIGSGYHIFKAGQRFYVGGGTDRSDRYVDYLYEYDYATDSWSKMANSPTAIRASFVSSTEIGSGKAIVLSSSIDMKSNHAYLYNSSTDRWSPTNTMSDTLYFEPNFSSVLFTSGKNTYFIGSGMTKEERSSTYNMLYQYDSADTSWKALVSYGYMEMYYPKAVEVDGHIYFASRNIRNEIHRLDIASGSMTEQALRIPTDGFYINDMISWKDGFIAVQGDNIFYYDVTENDWLKLPQGDFGNISKVLVEGDGLFVYDKSNDCFIEYLP